MMFEIFKNLFLNYKSLLDTKLRSVHVFWITLIIFGTVLYFLNVFQFNYSPTTTSEFLTEISYYNKFYEDFLVNTPGCRIPDMDVYDQTIQPYIWTEKPPICNKGTPALYAANLTSIYLLKESLVAYKVSDPTELKCCYKPFWRMDAGLYEVDDKVAYSKECHQVAECAAITDEFIQLICSYKNMTIYQDMFAFVPLKSSIVHAATNPKPLNVLVVGLDSVSRLNLHRQMPETVNYLQELGAIELLGYNKVADNTFPNVMPVLTGHYEEELVFTCIHNWKAHLDQCNFIWQDYKKRGYVTVFGEDASKIGLFYLKGVGFKKQNADYWYSYFDRQSEKQIGNSFKRSVFQCLGAREVYQVLLKYIQDFTETMGKQTFPYFGFFWSSSLTHDFLNKLKPSDHVFKQFFETLHKKHFNNTFFIFMSDHGIRFGDIRATYQGRMEERLPFLMLLPPDWFKRRYPKAIANLKRNTRRLTSPFDLHATLLHLLQPTLNEEHLDAHNTRSRQISLFREISKYRTCEDIGITPHWCTCQHSIKIDTNSMDVIHSANFVIKYINDQLKGYAQCAQLSLHSILKSRKIVHSRHIETGSNKTEYYIVTLQTKPGEGIFEATVKRIRQEYSTTGTISRLNLYGKQSACITDFHLKLYCYCRKIL